MKGVGANEWSGVEWIGLDCYGLLALNASGEPEEGGGVGDVG